MNFYYNYQNVPSQNSINRTSFSSWRGGRSLKRTWRELITWTINCHHRPLPTIIIAQSFLYSCCGLNFGFPSSWFFKYKFVMLILKRLKYYNPRNTQSTPWVFPLFLRFFYVKIIVSSILFYTIWAYIGFSRNIKIYSITLKFLAHNYLALSEGWFSTASSQRLTIKFPIKTNTILLWRNSHLRGAHTKNGGASSSNPSDLIRS